jgi:hypothetical protein
MACLVCVSISQRRSFIYDALLSDSFTQQLILHFYVNFPEHHVTFLGRCRSLSTVLGSYRYLLMAADGCTIKHQAKNRAMLDFEDAGSYRLLSMHVGVNARGYL